MSVINYNIDSNPTECGVYACRVPSDAWEGFYDDKFLMWIDGRWTHLGSDQNYRGEVTGWIGPLQRRMAKREGA